MSAGVFAQDSSLMRFLTRIADLMILNLLFLVTSLPLVTIGAALTALNFTAMRIATGTDGPIVGDYLRSFRRNLRQASILWLLVVVVGAALAAWYAVVTQSSLPSLAMIALLAIWYLLLFMSVMTALYVFLGAITYSLVYTVWLKRRTSSNIVVGGLAGSFAVLAGAAVQHIEGDVGFEGAQVRRHLARDVEPADAVAGAFGGVGAGLAGPQGDLALGRPTSHQDGDVFSHQ